MNLMISNLGKNRVDVLLEFGNTSFKCSLPTYQSDAYVRNSVVKVIDKRLVRRKRALTSGGVFDFYQPVFKQIRYRLSDAHKLKGEAFAERLIKIMPLLNDIAPKPRSSHYTSYQLFLADLNVFIHKFLRNESNY